MTLVAEDPTVARENPTRTVVHEATANHHAERIRVHREVRFADHAVKPSSRVSISLFLS